jgi:hypothetical protein
MDYARRGADPLGMTNAAGERPSSIDPVASVDRDGLAAWHKVRVHREGSWRGLASPPYSFEEFVPRRLTEETPHRREPG